MLELQPTLDNIPWSLIHGQNGTCNHIPFAIASLRSPDEKVRKDAYWSLENFIVVQGGLFEGAFYVVPFLYQTCVAQPPVGQADTLALLIEITRGASSFDLLVSFKSVPHPFLYFVPDSAGPGIPLPIACRYAVANGLCHVIDLITSPDIMVRENAKEMLSLFPEFAFSLCEKLTLIAKSNYFDECVKKDIRGLLRALLDS